MGPAVGHPCTARQGDLNLAIALVMFGQLCSYLSIAAVAGKGSLLPAGALSPPLSLQVSLLLRTELRVTLQRALSSLQGI